MLSHAATSAAKLCTSEAWGPSLAELCWVWAPDDWTPGKAALARSEESSPPVVGLSWPSGRAALARPLKSESGGLASAAAFLASCKTRPPLSRARAKREACPPLPPSRPPAASEKSPPRSALCLGLCFARSGAPGIVASLWTASAKSRTLPSSQATSFSAFLALLSSVSPWPTRVAMSRRRLRCVSERCHLSSMRSLGSGADRKMRPKKFPSARCTCAAQLGLKKGANAASAAGSVK
mmetsp:Transcript_4703/g.11052  ORF Transcript_4703/g.11052 Transcript_4703/m.11052 type:complete len:237 (+) Transcript_4703:337-1047(+)